MQGSVRGRAAVMTDVARLAGVSHQTVSRVLNNHPNVKPVTRDRVLRAMRKLDYRPNALARGLAGRHARIIGVISFGTALHGPAATLLGIERAARTAGYGVSIATLERADRSGVASAVRALADQAVAGIAIIAPQAAATAALQHLPPGLAAVGVESDMAGELPTVSVDQVAGACLAVTHLLDRGHRSIAHVAGPADSLEARGRTHGWRTTVEQAGLHPGPLLRGDWSARSGYHAGLDLAAMREMTAVFAGNDQMALGLLHAFAERGIRVPTDVSVVGFDDIPEAAYLVPALTTVRQDFDEIGRRCIATLLHHLGSASDDVTTGSLPERSVQPTLVVRASTAVVAVQG